MAISHSCCKQFQGPGDPVQFAYIESSAPIRLQKLMNGIFLPLHEARRVLVFEELFKTIIIEARPGHNRQVKGM